ncbi:MAG: TonB-dependent receptor [Ignavibacteriales bacterium]|nr:TonB-dependent receptor [Ignavibacteriales bacterium]
MNHLARIAILLTAFAAPLFAQFEGDEVDDELLEQLRQMSLEDILDEKISVASHVPLSTREAPGIVTVITREDLINTGARDLIDALTLLVPGFHFLQSEYGPIGLGSRGVFAYEGKMKIMIDGMTVNDEAYGGFIFGNRVNPENIERIEVIRGPGSVIHGGYAGLAVINVVTRDFASIDGAYVSGNLSRMSDAFSHRDVAFGYGDQIGDFDVSLTGFTGKGKLSDREYVPYFKGMQSFGAKHIEFRPLHANLDVRYDDFDLRLLYDRYDYDLEETFANDMLTALLQYRYELSESSTLRPYLEYKWQRPWQIEGEGPLLMDGVAYRDTAYRNDKDVIHRRLGVEYACEIFQGFHLLAGAEAASAVTKVNERKRGYMEISFGGTDSTDRIEAEEYVAFAQIIYQSEIGNLVVGGRYFTHSLFDQSFVPRVALTKILDPFHAKLMYSQSVTLPGSKYYNSALTSEKGEIYEFEVGYQISESNQFLLNGYMIDFRDVIGFRLNETTGYNYYDNFERIGSRGFEIEHRMVTSNFRLGMNAGWSVLSDNSNALIAVPDEGKRALGFPHLTFNAYATIKLEDDVAITPSFTYFGERYGYIGGELHETPAGIEVDDQIKEFGSTFLLNLNFNTKDLVADGLDVDIGIRNLLNQYYEYLQPFRGYMSPLPAPTMSATLRVYYELPF